ncbi:pantetheine-phosphate adenylyltransferase [Candidatus Poribacteria bacterium]|nr:pantetheine-phosphate adenylyltransferase [Candidatus Poribacteria bacterium]
MPGRIALFPASFDPITNGHVDIITRALAMDVFDALVLAVGVNPAKPALFTVAERFDLLRLVMQDLPYGERVRAETLDGLMVEHARQIGASAIVRGIRSPLDFEYEAQMAFLNRHLAPEIEIVFLIADPQYAFLSSTLVKQVAEMGGDLEGLVPGVVIRALRERVQADKTRASRRWRPPRSSSPSSE